jgi:hypothetical protein
MTETKHAWQEVGERFEALALKLKLHLEEERADRDDVEDSDALREALERATAALEDVFDALGDAADDVAVKSDLRELAGSFGSALETTLNDLSARIANTFGGSR